MKQKSLIPKVTMTLVTFVIAASSLFVSCQKEGEKSSSKPNYSLRDA
jgi:hypothetical protein